MRRSKTHHIATFSKKSLTFLPLSFPTSPQNILCSYDPQAQFRLAIGSYVGRYSNSIQIIKKKPSDQSNEDFKNATSATSSSAAAGAGTGTTSPQDSQMYKACEFDHPYPCTKVLWNPDLSSSGKDLVATTGDYLRLWNLEDDGSGLGTMVARKEIMLNSASTLTFLSISLQTFFNLLLFVHQ